MDGSMNRVMEVLDQRERSVNWLAKKLGMSRQALTYKIEHDTFTRSQKYDAAAHLWVEPTKLFPERESEAETA